MKPSDKTCVLKVKNGKAWCETHRTNHEIGDWEDHKDHQIHAILFHHVLYTGSICISCNDGKILIDEEQ